MAGPTGSGEEAVDLKNIQEVKLVEFGNWLNAGVRKNEESLICPGYNLGWITRLVLGSAANIEGCREGTGGKGQGEAS